MLRLRIYKFLHFLHILSKEEYKKKSAPYKYRLSPEYKAIAKSKLFDKWWYLQQNPDVAKAGKDPIEHYLKYGWKNEKRPTTPYFDEKKYIEMYPDVKEANVPPLLHWIQYGAPEGRHAPLLEYKRPSWWERMKKSHQKEEIKIVEASRFFDEKWYLKQYPEVKDSGISPRKHYDTIGWKKGYNPSENFDTVWYLTKYSDVAKANMNPLRHYLNYGIKERRITKSEEIIDEKVVLKEYFDEEWYCNQYPEVKNSGLLPLEHYNSIGWKKGYNPSRYFNTNYYLKKYPFIVERDFTPLEHFIKYGYQCGSDTMVESSIFLKNLSLEGKKIFLSKWFRKSMGTLLNLDEPKTYNEKIQWLKLYDSTQIKTKLADKYLVRDWVKEKIGEQYLIPLLGVYDNFDEIDFDKLPNQFVIKCNHSSGTNIIVKDKIKLDLIEAKKKIENWMKIDPAYDGSFQLFYSAIKPRIVIEKYIENKNAGDLYDYKFWCFNGRVEYIQFLSERYFGEHSLKMAFYDRNWMKQSFVYNYPLDKKNIEKPSNLEQMIELAEKLAKGFNHVRVDFYRLDNGEIYFGEMTFSSASGACLWNEENINNIFGDLIKLPQLAYNVDTGAYFKLPKDCGEVIRKNVPNNILKYPHYNNKIWNNEDYFDENWYISQYPEVKKSGIYARKHYENTGWKKGYNPSPRFKTKEYLKNNPECKICPLTFEQNRNGYVDLSIVAIMKNEAPYVKEWIDYHRLVGVKRFYIYDNESEDNLKEVLTPYIKQGIVVYKYYPGKYKEDDLQVKSYQECIDNYKNNTEWLAIIDPDEYIIPIKNKTIPEFMKNYKDEAGVVINWVCYDSNGHIEKPQGGVLENYTKVRKNYYNNWNNHVKSIVNPRKVSIPRAHISKFINNELPVNEYFKVVPHSFMNPLSIDKIRINHYWTKSQSEFLKKSQRARNVGNFSLKNKELYDFPEYLYDYVAWKYVVKLGYSSFIKEFSKYLCLGIKNIWIKRRPSIIETYFNAYWYIKHYKLPFKSYQDAYEHYTKEGWKKGYNPSKYFDTKFYLTKYPDVARANICPLEHFLNHGIKEKRSPMSLSGKSSIFKKFTNKNSDYELLKKSEYFDEKYYTKQCPEVLSCGLNAIEHYNQIGWKKGYNPSKRFNVKYYLYEYPDIKKADINPLIHYIKYGKKEGRHCFPVLPIPYQNEKRVCSNPLVSIIVASYNYAHLLPKTLDSLLKQSYRNFEIIAVDDGSKDDSVKILKKYAAKYDNIFVYRHKQGANLGLAETIKLGLNKAKGEYVAFCESDDFWSSDYLEKKINIVNNFAKVNIISNGIELFGDESGIQSRQPYLDKISEFLDEGANMINLNFVPKMNWIPTFSCVMIKKDILQKLDFNSPIPAWLDFWLYRQILIKYPLYHIHEHLTYWRMHKSFNDVAKAEKNTENSDLFILKSNILINLPYENSPDYKIIKCSNYWDEKYYTKQYQSDFNGLDAVSHYLYVGWKKGYNPSPMFDNNTYLGSYIDVYKANINPLLHYELYGIKEQRDIRPVGTFQNIDEIEYQKKIKNIKKHKKAILLFSHELSLTGAPRALLNMAVSLKKQGYYPVIMSWKKGDMVEEIKKSKIELLIDSSLYLKLKNKDSVLIEFLSAFDVILFNTLVSLHLFDYFPKVKVKKIAWLHEGKMSYDVLGKELNLREIFNTLDKIYSVGEYSQSFANQYMTNIEKSKMLLYGMPDIAIKPNKYQQNTMEPIKFILPGAISQRKGHDILLKAYDLLSDNIKSKIIIYIVGPSTDKELEKQLNKITQKEKYIKYIGIMPHDELLKFYQKMDVILCPSRDDPMPIVCTEAFILQKTVIVSDNTGTASLIKNEYDGFVIPSENPEALAQAMSYLVQNKEKIRMIGINSRKIYEKYFTEERFDYNVRQIFK